jgi:hypothetical protein
MSGRAAAPVDINIPAPMVAANATAILNDIDLSPRCLVTPFRGRRFSCEAHKRRVAAGHADAFLIAQVNQPVAMRALKLIQQGGNKVNVGNKVNARKTTPSRKRTAEGDVPLTTRECAGHGTHSGSGGF